MQRDLSNYFKLFFWGMFTVYTSACTHEKPVSSPPQKQYIDEVITLLKKHSINKHSIDWNKLSDSVYILAANGKTIYEAYPAITYAVQALNDNHSYFAPAIHDDTVENDKPLPVYKDEDVPEDIGYIRIPFCIGDERQTETYINNITKSISSQNRKNLTGWIIDLRENFGGNMWPMMASAAPFFSNGIQGYFIDADEKISTWRYENGNVFMDTIPMENNKYVVSLSHHQPRIAVLINNRTASSGEAIAVVFKGMQNTKFFGEKTFGVSTGCEPFELSDGSRINLATSVFADRHKTKYGSHIQPDIVCDSALVLKKAIDWLRN